MPFSYSKLWERLTLDNKSKTEFAKEVGITSTTLAKLGKNQNVNMDVLSRICEHLNCNLEDIVQFIPNKNKLKVVSLFAGIGGFEDALLRSQLSAETILASENDKYACNSYHSNFPKINLKSDITKIETKDIPSHDLLVGGFPCQAFSIAGRRHGFKDTRGTLFFDIERILKDKKPKYLLLENVKNLISHDGGETINTILLSLNELGYTIDFSVINSKEAGLPQSRERTYILGILNGKTEPFEIDPRNKKVNNLKSKLNQSEYKSFNFFNHIKFDNPIRTLSDILDDEQDDRYYLTSDKVGQFLKSQKIVDDHTKSSSIKKLFDLPRNVHNDNERQRRVYSTSGISPTILARSDSTKLYIEKNNKKYIRKITPTEALRAQGFDEQFIDKIKSSGVSQTQLYKQAGNAVSPPVVVGILNGLHQLIMSEN